MSGKSFSNRLSWRILLIVMGFSIIAQVVMTLFVANASNQFSDLFRESRAMLIYMNGIALVSLVVLFFVCRAIINRMTRYREELTLTAEANARMESDLTLARNIQLGMVSTDFPPYMYALLDPAKEVGGDLYDFIVKDDRLYFAIGDVSGKGLPASLVMAITSATLRLVVEMGLPMDETLQRINDSFSKSNRSDMFVTLFIASVELKTGRMEYCNAGHCPILVIPPDEAPYLLKCTPNIAVGMFEHFQYVAEQTSFKAGTRLVAYTDGVTEAERDDLSLFGSERLLRWAGHVQQDGRDWDEKTVVESLFQTVREFADGNKQNDDIAIVEINIK